MWGKACSFVMSWRYLLAAFPRVLSLHEDNKLCPSVYVFTGGSWAPPAHALAGAGGEYI